jgi:3-deoxy-manno-octulosonate cytidylyltransferase (CMP-KDO synthetase)
MVNDQIVNGIIPARYASTRFPGKPLALIGGKPMIQRVYEQACKALDTVVVATDDQRIFDCVRSFGGEVVMTRPDHKCGTDRCLEAFEILTAQRSNSEALKQQSTQIIINIQGDEPFIQPEQIKALQSCFEDPATQIATLVRPFTEADTLSDLENPNTPKVAVAPDGTALLFSRSVIPYLRGVDKNDWLKQGRFYRHIGMYAYRADVLRQITQLEQTPLEKAESLEQLRWLENGYKIKVALCTTSSIGIDTPEDLIKANELLANGGLIKW